MRVLLYSATYGGHDVAWLWEGQELDEGVLLWQWRLDDGGAAAPSVSTRLQARFPKCRPPADVVDGVGADVSIWVDGSIEITSRYFVATMLEALGDAEIALFRHASRSSIAEELAVVDGMAKYAGARHLEYVEQLGGRHGDGLFELGVMVRRRTPAVEEFNRLLWARTLEWSGPLERQDAVVMDQLLVPPLLAELELSPAIIPGSIWVGGDRHTFRLHNHADGRNG